MHVIAVYDPAESDAEKNVEHVSTMAVDGAVVVDADLDAENNEIDLEIEESDSEESDSEDEGTQNFV